MNELIQPRVRSRVAGDLIILNHAGGKEEQKEKSGQECVINGGAEFAFPALIPVNPEEKAEENRDQRRAHQEAFGTGERESRQRQTDQNGLPDRLFVEEAEDEIDEENEKEVSRGFRRSGYAESQEFRRADCQQNAPSCGDGRQKAFQQEIERRDERGVKESAGQNQRFQRIERCEISDDSADQNLKNRKRWIHGFRKMPVCEQPGSGRVDIADVTVDVCQKKHRKKGCCNGDREGRPKEQGRGNIAGNGICQTVYAFSEV